MPACLPSRHCPNSIPISILGVLRTYQLDIRLFNRSIILSFNERTNERTHEIKRTETKPNQTKPKDAKRQNANANQRQ